MRADSGSPDPRDLVQLELLRKGLDGVTPPRAWQETG
jgi:hypothetical protein